MPAEPAAAGPGKCPICGRPSENDYRPFCSRRCADVDLARWLRGVYVIPEQAEIEEDGADLEGQKEGSDPSLPEDEGKSQGRKRGV